MLTVGKLRLSILHTPIALTSTSAQDDGGGSHGLLNVVIQDTALKGRVKRPFLICVTAGCLPNSPWPKKAGFVAAQGWRLCGRLKWLAGVALLPRLRSEPRLDSQRAGVQGRVCRHRARHGATTRSLGCTTEGCGAGTDPGVEMTGRFRLPQADTRAAAITSIIMACMHVKVTRLRIP